MHIVLTVLPEVEHHRTESGIGDGLMESILFVPVDHYRVVVDVMAGCVAIVTSQEKRLSLTESRFAGVIFRIRPFAGTHHGLLLMNWDAVAASHGIGVASSVGTKRTPPCSA